MQPTKNGLNHSSLGENSGRPGSLKLHDFLVSANPSSRMISVMRKYRGKFGIITSFGKGTRDL